MTFVCTRRFFCRVSFRLHQCVYIKRARARTSRIYTHTHARFFSRPRAKSLKGIIIKKSTPARCDGTYTGEKTGRFPEVVFPRSDAVAAGARARAHAPRSGNIARRFNGKSEIGACSEEKNPGRRPFCERERECGHRRRLVCTDDEGRLGRRWRRSGEERTREKVH